LNRGTENKYESPFQGPFDFTQVNYNGTVHLKVYSVEDTYNTRRIIPFHAVPDPDYGEVCSALSISLQPLQLGHKGNRGVFMHSWQNVPGKLTHCIKCQPECDHSALRVYTNCKL